MSTFPRVGIVGGNGWIGGALARAFVAADLLPPSRLTLSCRSEAPDWLPEAAWTHDNQALADNADVVILSVRPQEWPAVNLAATGKLVVSVMAGIPLADLARRTGTVRALPNAAAQVGSSYTPWTATTAVTDADRAIVRRIFRTCGTGRIFEKTGENPADTVAAFVDYHRGSDRGHAGCRLRKGRQRRSRRSAGEI
jgi:pyrroline-5-carboxylate reductase